MQKRKINWKRFKHKAHNSILKAVTWVAGILALTSACAFDSESWIPKVVYLLCIAWLTMFAYANGLINE